MPDWEFFETSSTLWSPDGQYLATGVSTLSLVGTTNGAPPVNQPERCLGEVILPCPSTMWPAPDAGFAAAAARGAGRLPLAWRPDGKILAAAWPGDEFDPTNLTLRVSLLSTATDQAVAKATAPAEVHGFFGYPSLLSRPYFSWAPDSTQLAYNDGMDNRIYIWNTSAGLANLAG